MGSLSWRYTTLKEECIDLGTEGPRMNKVELSEALQGIPKWTRFAEKLGKSMTDEFKLDGVTVLIRELNTEETANEERDVLVYNHELQRFEFGVSPAEGSAPPWRVADRIDHFLNPDVEP